MCSPRAMTSLGLLRHVEAAHLTGMLPQMATYLEGKKSQQGEVMELLYI